MLVTHCTCDTYLSPRTFGPWIPNVLTKCVVSPDRARILPVASLNSPIATSRVFSSLLLSSSFFPQQLRRWAINALTFDHHAPFRGMRAC